MQNHCISGMPQCINVQFLTYFGERHVVVTSFTHIHGGLQQILILKIFSSFKMLENAQNAENRLF